MLKNERFQKIILLVTSIIAFFSTLWIRGADIMEARNFITAREILQSGNWMTTTLNGEFRFEKPPLPTWITAGIMKLFNNMHDEGILRIPAALAGILMVFLIYRLVKRISGDSLLGFFCAFVSSTSFMLIKVSGENSWDVYPYVFILGAVTFILDGILTKKNIYFIFSGVFIGASIMSKGPVGIYGLLLPFIPAYGFVYGWKDLKNNIKGIVLAFFIGGLLAAVWPALMMIQDKDLFLSVLKKEKDTWTTKHVKSFFFYLDYFAFMGVWAVPSLAVLFKKWSFKRCTDKKLMSFGILWNVLVFLLLSVIKMKKQRYGVPLYITSSILVGSLMRYYFYSTWEELKKSDRALFFFQSGLISIISVGTPILIYFKGFITGVSSLAYLSLILLLYILVLIAVISVYKTKRDSFIKAIVLGSGFFMLLVNLTTNQFVERYVRGKYNTDLPLLEELQKTPLKTPVFSEDFAIDDVWNIGVKIKKIEDASSLPDQLILLRRENSQLKNIAGYRVKKEENYYRFRNENEKITVIHLKKEAKGEEND